MTDIEELEEEVEEEECQKPCPPNQACDGCAPYWERMRKEGFWDDNIGWTLKGWREIIKG